MEDFGDLKVFGNHDGGTIAQMWRCLGAGGDKAVLCADGHKGYAQPVGGVVAYRNHISVSGVGFDIGCGNTAARTNIPFSAVKDRVGTIVADIRKQIAFGVGQVSKVKLESDLFDLPNWKDADLTHLKDMAREQFGSVGSGNHYVDLFEGDDGMVWVGVHFGSRGLGHKTASKYLALAGGKDGMDVAPAILDQESELGKKYLLGMEMCGQYARDGRVGVVKTCLRILGSAGTEWINNHHNYAWRENHDGIDYWVVRKGATPSNPNQKGFVGGSMGDNAVIIEGLDTELNRATLYSTVHGAGRVMSRSQAKKTFTQEDMNAWLTRKGVYLSGGGLDESPEAYRRLDEVLAFHDGTIKVLHNLRPFAVLMAGKGDRDPYKD